MFYSHGGGFTTGSGGAGYQDGGNLARTWDVVVVATNHRLGLMGYLYLGELGGEEYATSGNQGLLDICEGLKWVHDNIEAFGCDSGNVMIFGESGGGAKTSRLYAMCYLKPLLARIEKGEIDPSFVVTHRMNLDEAPQAYDTFLNKEDECIKVIFEAVMRLSPNTESSPGTAVG